MNSLRNRVQLIGRLGADPEVKQLEKGMRMSRFSLATNEVLMREGKKVQQTQWHTLVVWGKLADTCARFLKKGKEVAVEGKIIYHTWKDKQGLEHNSTEIVVSELVMLGVSTSD